MVNDHHCSFILSKFYVIAWIHIHDSPTGVFLAQKGREKKLLKMIYGD